MLRRAASLSPGVGGARRCWIRHGCLVSVCVQGGRAAAWEAGGTSLRDATLLFTSPASNPSPAASWRGCRGAFEVGLSSTAVYVTQKNTPLCPSVLSFTCGQILPGSSASMQQRDSVVELLLVLSALILVGAVRWVLCSKPSPISVLG